MLCSSGFVYISVKNILEAKHSSLPVEVYLLGQMVIKYKYYRQISEMMRTLLSNKLADHSDVVGAEPVQLLFHSRLNTWLQWIGQRQLNCKMRRQLFKFGNLLRLILEVWWQVFGGCNMWNPFQQNRDIIRRHPWGSCSRVMCFAVITW